MSQSKSSCSRVKDKALIVDMYGNSFSFMLPGGQKKYKSLVGSILTVLTVLGVILYTVYKTAFVFDDSANNVTKTFSYGHYNELPDSTFSTANGLKIAIGISSITR